MARLARSPIAIMNVLVVTVTAFYLVAFFVSLPRLLPAIYQLADNAIAPYLMQGWEHAPSGAHMLMANVPWYSAYWLMRVLDLLPDHRVLWEFAPWLLSGLACGCVGWATAKAAGRGAGLLVSAGLICAGTALLPLQFAWGVHGITYVYVLLLGAFGVWLTNDSSQRRSAWFWGFVCLMTALTAVGVASDPLVLVAGLLPFAGTGVALAARSPETLWRRRLRAAIAAVTFGSVVGSVLFGAVMRSAGLAADHYPIELVSPGEIGPHLLLLLQGTFALLNGYLHEGPVWPFGYLSPTGLLGYCCSVAVVVLVVLAVSVAVRVVRSRSDTTASADGVSPAMFAHTVYWLMSAVVLAVIYVFSNAAVDLQSKRYIVTVAYAVLILGVTGGMTLRSRRPVQFVVAACVAVVVVSGAVGLVRSQIAAQYRRFPSLALSKAVAALAHAEHVKVGYAGYWDAFPLGWLSSSSVPVYPITRCEMRLCPTVRSTASVGVGIDSWYRSRPHIRSMLVLDPVFDPSDSLPSRAPAYLGHPLGRVHVIDQRLDVYVYDYDIAGRLARS
jgi:hypothetical protein